jgi:hypothetical protein
MKPVYNFCGLNAAFYSSVTIGIQRRTGGRCPLGTFKAGTVCSLVKNTVPHYPLPTHTYFLHCLSPYLCILQALYRNLIFAYKSKEINAKQWLYAVRFDCPQRWLCELWSSGLQRRVARRNRPGDRSVRDFTYKLQKASAIYRLKIKSKYDSWTTLHNILI